MRLSIFCGRRQETPSTRKSLECRSQDSLGKYGCAQKVTVSRHPHTGVLVKEAFSETLSEVGVLKKFTANDLNSLSNELSEALAHAKCCIRTYAVTSIFADLLPKTSVYASS